MPPAMPKTEKAADVSDKGYDIQNSGNQNFYTAMMLIAVIILILAVLLGVVLLTPKKTYLVNMGTGSETNMLSK